MRFRDFCCVLLVMLVVIFASSKVHQTATELSFASVEINREDANRESSTILSTDEWVDFQIESEATSLRLMTNVALDSKDVPEHDLDNPRTGWRYAVEYELLDANGNSIKQANYHFRSQVNQLMDIESNEPIYPIFFGKSSLVATQTRAMQIPINQGESRAVVLRVRVAKADPKIQEIVARVLSRTEREDYDKRTTWNRMSTVRRTGLSRFCVYDHDLLTIGERNNLLRWQWKSAPVISDFNKRYLFFIGDIDDQQIRNDQLPAGLYVDPDWLGTIPVPEHSQRVRLEFRWVENQGDADASYVVPIKLDGGTASIQWMGADAADRSESLHMTDQPISEMQVAVEGGLIQIHADQPVVIRAFVLASDLTGEIGKPDQASREIEITPEMNCVRSFLSDRRPVSYSVTHFDGQPTPMRVVLRYPYAPLFDNLGDTVDETDYAETLRKPVEATWELLAADGALVSTGQWNLSPLRSQYDRFTVAGKREPVSDPAEFYLAIPTDAATVRITSPDHRLLVSAYVRPVDSRSVIQIPEDSHVFSRATSTNRTWFGMNPDDHESMIQKNQSFIVQTQFRPADPNQEIVAGRYEWERFYPSGNWIARQILVPRELDLDVRQSAVGSVHYEVQRGVRAEFQDHPGSGFAGLEPVKIVFVSDDHPGKVSVRINGRIVLQDDFRSARGEVFLEDVEIDASGTIKIDAENESRFFLVGKEVAGATPFLQRSAQRLKDGQLNFQYTKTSHEEELLTLQLFRPASESTRCGVQIDISSDAALIVRDEWQPSWTIRNREYDLRAQQEHRSVLVGASDRVDAGHRCFVRLGSDLPPGDYQIQVRRSDGASDGYALLYKVVPGQRANRAVQVRSILGVDNGT